MRAICAITSPIQLSLGRARKCGLWLQRVRLARVSILACWPSSRVSRWPNGRPRTARWWRSTASTRGPGLLVPAEYDGPAADPLQAARVQRAARLGVAVAGVATVMHHFTVAMLFSLAADRERLTAGTAEDAVSAVATDGLLLASGWAEGRTDQNILLPTVVAEPTDGGYVVNGSKKPCSLSRRWTCSPPASSITDDRTAGASLALLLIPAQLARHLRHPVLDQPRSWPPRRATRCILKDVQVPEELVIRSTPEDQHRLDDLQTAGFTWFELLTTASYVGAASALVELVLTAAAAASPAVARRWRSGWRRPSAWSKAPRGRSTRGVAGDDAVAVGPDHPVRHAGPALRRVSTTPRSSSAASPSSAPSTSPTSLRGARPGLPPAVARQRGRTAGRLLRRRPLRLS